MLMLNPSRSVTRRMAQKGEVLRDLPKPLCKMRDAWQYEESFRSQGLTQPTVLSGYRYNLNTAGCGSMVMIEMGKVWGK